MDKDPEKLETTSQKLARDENGRLLPGQPSLNPNGRPKGSLDFKTKWERMVDKIAMQNNLTPEEIDEQLLFIGYKKAKEGDYSFYRDVMDRIHGKPLQVSEINNPDGNLKTIIINKSHDTTNQ